MARGLGSRPSLGYPGDKYEMGLEAIEEIEAETVVDGIGIGFNVNYLLEAISALRGEKVLMQMRDANSSALVREVASEACRHVVMPLRL